MANRKVRYVDKRKVMKMDGVYNIILGERSNGKSYATKTGLIEACYKSGKQFAYLRRYDLDCKDAQCEPYFADVPVTELTNNEYSMISVFRKKIYLANPDENGKIKRGQCIGLCMALTNSEHYKSLAFPDIDYMIYEEFITDKTYLMNEPTKLMNLASTIFRDRKGKVYLVGNKISRLCPYFTEWELKQVPKMREDTIEDYIFHEDEVDIKIQVYMTHSKGYNSGMFFGQAAKQIIKGAWEASQKPHLEKPIEEYDIIYTMIMEFDQSRFMMQLLRPKTNIQSYIWYVTPKTSQIQKNTRVISNHYNESPYFTKQFIPLSERESRIFQFLEEGKIAYSDNLTGTEFAQAYSSLQLADVL